MNEVPRVPMDAGPAVVEAARCDIAVVVPAFNEAESLPELVDRIEEAVDSLGLTWEVWIIDDGSTVDTFAATE